MKPEKRYVWATIEAKTSDDLEKACKEKYPAHVIVERSIIRVDYEREKPYRQVFVLIKLKSKKS